MKVPASPPDSSQLLQRLAQNGGRLIQLTALGLKPEVGGRYLHWDELRRRPPPEGLTSEEWWAGLVLARRVVRTELPLVDGQGRGLHFSQTESLLADLHVVAREMGERIEGVDPRLVDPKIRNRYLPRSLMEEAITSSQLEGATTTRLVAKEMLETQRTPRTHDERMIFNNYQAMELIRSRKNAPLTPSLILELQQVLTEGTLAPSDSGRLRRRDETVRVQDSGTGDVLHIPPDADQLPARLDALCAFANQTEGAGFIHPIVRAIVLHFMLAYDHPFVDGNGRTARALFYWCMLRHGYWMAEYFSISRIIQRARSQYSLAYLHSETDGGDLTYFLLHQLDVIRKAMQELYAYFEQKTQELKEVDAQPKDAERLNHRQWALVKYLSRHPKVEYAIEEYRAEHDVVYQTARQDLLDLEKAGYLVMRRVGRAFRFRAAPELAQRVAREQKR
jgi:Fic family protein